MESSYGNVLDKLVYDPRLLRNSTVFGAEPFIVVHLTPSLVNYFYARLHSHGQRFQRYRNIWPVFAWHLFVQMLDTADLLYRFWTFLASLFQDIAWWKLYGAPGFELCAWAPAMQGCRLLITRKMGRAWAISLGSLVQHGASRLRANTAVGSGLVPGLENVAMIVLILRTTLLQAVDSQMSRGPVNLAQGRRAALSGDSETPKKRESPVNRFRGMGSSPIAQCCRS